MLNTRIKITSKTILSLLFIIAFLPAPAAAEKSDDLQIKDLEEKIFRSLSSELEKDPDLKGCKITVDLDFEKDAGSGKWNVNVSKCLLISAESISDTVEIEEAAVGDDGIDDELNGDDTDSYNEYGDEETEGRSNILGWIIAVVFVIIVCFAVYSRWKHKFKALFAQPETEEKREDYRHHRQTKTDETLASHTRQINHEGDGSKSNKGQQIATNPSVVQHQSVIKPVSHEEITEKTQSTEMKTEPVPAVPIIKYGQIAVLSQNELTTEEDYMSDEATGMPFVFSFSPNMQDGTYDISDPSRTSFLRDINIIRPFVQNFDDISNPTKIVTINKGKLRRNGLSWVVTEKLKIQLL